MGFEGKMDLTGKEGKFIIYIDCVAKGGEKMGRLQTPLSQI
jgi:hypothetical protein